MLSTMNKIQGCSKFFMVYRLRGSTATVRCAATAAQKPKGELVSSEKDSHGHGHGHGHGAAANKGPLQEWESYHGTGFVTDVNELKKIWREQNAVFYGPERDLKNFPPVRIAERPATRFYVLPASWFDAFYSKVGVTGPYALIFTSLTFLFSKEYIVFEHNVCEWMCYVLLISLAIRKYGSRLGAFLDKNIEKQTAQQLEPIREYAERARANVKALEQFGDLDSLQRSVTQAKREQVDLQLEAQYRDRLVHAHEEVKNRLDYFSEREQTQRKYEQQHLLAWVSDQVTKSITPNFEREAISACLNDLRALAAQTKKAASA